jgi:hypothetical protein
MPFFPAKEILAGKVGEDRLRSGRYFLDSKELITGVGAPGLIKPLLVFGKGRIADVNGVKPALLSSNNTASKSMVHTSLSSSYTILLGKYASIALSQGYLIDRLENKIASNLFAQCLSALLRVARLAKEATCARCNGAAGTKWVRYEFGH